MCCIFYWIFSAFHFQLMIFSMNPFFTPWVKMPKYSYNVKPYYICCPCPMLAFSLRRVTSTTFVIYTPMHTASRISGVSNLSLYMIHGATQANIREKEKIEHSLLTDCCCLHGGNSALHLTTRSWMNVRHLPHRWSNPTWSWNCTTQLSFCAQYTQPGGMQNLYTQNPF